MISVANVSPITSLSEFRRSRSTRYLLIVLMALLCLEFVNVWRKWAIDVALETDRNTRTIDAMEATMAAAGPRADTIAQVRRELIATRSSFILAPSTVQITTIAASLIADAARTAAINLGTLDIRVDSVSDGAVRIARVDAEATGTFTEVVAFLKTLDSGTPFFTRQVAVEPTSQAGTSNRAIHVRFGVIALARTPFEFER